MLKTAVDCGQPVAIRYPRGEGFGVALDSEPMNIEIGKAEVVREGKDIAIIAIGSTVHPSVEAAEELKQEGIDATVINSRFVKPLDRELLCRVASSIKKVLIVEENVLMGGFGSAVLEVFEEEGVCDIRVKRVGIPDEFVEQGTQAELRRQYGIDRDGIREAVKKLMQK